MKKNAYVIDFSAQTLTLTAAFVDAANNPESDEYALLCQFQRDFPNLRIVRKTHKTPMRYRNSDGSTYSFLIESYLCSSDTEVYKAAEALKVGDVIDMEGFLYWYEGVQPHITSISPAA